MTSNDLFLQIAVEFAAATLGARSYVSSVLINYPYDDPPCTLPIEEVAIDGVMEVRARKGKFSMDAHELAEYFGADRVAVVNEAWLTSNPAETSGGMQLRHKYDGWDPALGDSPYGNAMEVMSIVVGSRDGETIGALYEIIDGPTRRLGRCLTSSEDTQTDEMWKAAGCNDPGALIALKSHLKAANGEYELPSMPLHCLPQDLSIRPA